MKIWFTAVLLASLVASALAAEPDLNRIKSSLAKTFPEVATVTLRPSPLSGLYELVLDTQIYYVSADGKHLFLGDLVETRTRTNLTEAAREKISTRLLNEIGEHDMVVLAPKETRHTITVFTDVDCPYCARLHQDVPELNRQGVKVRYLLYPRAGIGSETYRRSVAAWCAADRIKAVGIAKNGGRLDMKTCANPVERHYRLGERLGISGTPTIYLENGRKIPGYVPPAQLLALVGAQNGLPRPDSAPGVVDAAR
jgi:thiol:disulfide interchange protein DsbC